MSLSHSGAYRQDSQGGPRPKRALDPMGVVCLGADLHLQSTTIVKEERV